MSRAADHGPGEAPGRRDGRAFLLLATLIVLPPREPVFLHKRKQCSAAAEERSIVAQRLGIRVGQPFPRLTSGAIFWRRAPGATPLYQAPTSEMANLQGSAPWSQARLKSCADTNHAHPLVSRCF